MAPRITWTLQIYYAVEIFVHPNNAERAACISNPNFAGIVTNLVSYQFERASHGSALVAGGNSNFSTQQRCGAVRSVRAAKGLWDASALSKLNSWRLPKLIKIK